MKKLILLALIAVAGEAAAEDAKCVRERAAMIETIRAYARSDAGLFGPQGISERVLAAMGQTERHRFIPGASCSVAYADRPVSIGQEQTISQPLIVAVMTHLAQVKFDHTVLEVGTGSGYQAAILSQLTRKVCTVEIIPPLAEAAAEVLRDLGYDNVSVKGRRRVPWLGGMRPFRRSRRDSCARACPATADRTTKSGRPAHNATGARSLLTAAHHRRKDRSK
jgi:protein-L-isoaspartate(D-aspartate) O-methyltransferase